MKTTSKIIAIAFVLLGSSMNVFSTDPSKSVYIKLLGNKNFAIYMSGVYAEQTQVSLRDGENNVIHEEMLKENELYSKKFNLQQLASGRYILELETETNIERIPLLLTDNELTFLTNEKQLFYKPFMRHDGNVLDLMHFAPEEASMEMLVTDKYNNVVFKEELKKDIKVERQYDFSAFATGTYYVTVGTQGRQYQYTMPVQ